jgi:UDP-galactopyranose mutase
MRYDYLIVGCGFFGSVFAQQARENGKSVIVVERRPHIGGNCYTRDYEDTGISLHVYGTHIFHCSDEVTWRYINRFTAFNRYQHRVLTTFKGKVYSMPINLGTINSFFGASLHPDEVAGFLDAQRPSGGVKPENLEDQAISLIGRPLYDAFIRGYTRKQWGQDPRELPASIITRLPVRNSYHDAYFDDRYQGIPVAGYTPIFERMLEGIPVELGVDFFAEREVWEKLADKIVYTGPIDRYFDYCYGSLNWRSVRFEVERIRSSDYQGTAVMNYADEEIPYTRIHEPKHLHLERQWNRESTVIVREFSQVNPEQPYYPVNLPRDQEVYEKYSALQKEHPNVIFGGRLARYKYFDMHQVIASALAAARKELAGESTVVTG